MLSAMLAFSQRAALPIADSRLPAAVPGIVCTDLNILTASATSLFLYLL
jgi:hypothetical protein